MGKGEEGTYQGSYFKLKVTGQTLEDDAFCKTCAALKSNHTGEASACPVKGDTTFRLGGTFAYWLLESPEKAHFTSDSDEVRRLMVGNRLAKLLMSTGERACWVSSSRPEMDISFDESRMLLRLLGEAFKTMNENPDPDLIGNCTPDEVGNLIGKLLSIPL